MSTLNRAIEIAAAAHAGQVDKAGRPYILHPLRVMLAVSAGPEPVTIAAVLHDVLEDCEDWTAGRLAAEGFAPGIIAALKALTRRPGETYDGFVERCRADPIARTVKLADLADNMDRSRITWASTHVDEARLATYARAEHRLKEIDP